LAGMLMPAIRAISWFSGCTLRRIKTGNFAYIS
jgi:hypothetical protein